VYEVKHIDSAPVIAESKKKWKDSKSKDVWSAITLVKAGFLLRGYGSNFPEESTVPIANEMLGLGKLRFVDVVKQEAEAVKQ